MFRRIKRSARIGAAYASSLSHLFALESRLEVQRIGDRVLRQSIAVGLVVFGFGWLNLGILTWIWDSPYRHWAPFAIGAALAVVAAVLWATASNLWKQPAFVATKRALAEDLELWDVDLLPEHVLDEPTAEQRAAKAAERAARKAQAKAEDEMLEPAIEQTEQDLGRLRAALHANVARADRPTPASRERRARDAAAVAAGVAADVASRAGAGGAPGRVSPAERAAAAARVDAARAEIARVELQAELHAVSGDATLGGVAADAAARTAAAAADGAAAAAAAAGGPDSGRARAFVPKSQTMRLAVNFADSIDSSASPVRTLLTRTAQELLDRQALPGWIGLAWPAVKVATRLVADDRRARQRAIDDAIERELASIRRAERAERAASTVVPSAGVRSTAEAGTTRGPRPTPH